MLTLAFAEAHKNITTFKQTISLCQQEAFKSHQNILYKQW